MKLKVIIASALIMCVSSVAFAQYEEKMQEEGVVHGTVTVNGETIEGYIKKDEVTFAEKTHIAYYSLQKSIKFIDKSTFENTEKIKRKMYTTYTPKNCQGFTYESEVFDVRRYADNSAVGFNMIPRNMFMRQIKVNGPVTFYLHYNTPSIVYTGEGAYEAEMTEIFKNPHLAYFRDGMEKPEMIDHLTKKDFADCPRIQQKMENKEYEKSRTKEDNEALYGIAEYHNISLFDERNLNVLEDFIKNGCQ
jgi:hypothetical protein